MGLAEDRLPIKKMFIDVGVSDDELELLAEGILGTNVFKAHTLKEELRIMYENLQERLVDLNDEFASIQLGEFQKATTKKIDKMLQSGVVFAIKETRFVDDPRLDRIEQEIKEIQAKMDLLSSFVISAHYGIKNPEVYEVFRKIFFLI